MTLDAAEIDDLLERARRFKPIPTPWPPRDQCLRDALAASMRVDPLDLPMRKDDETLAEWIAEVESRFPVRLDVVPIDELPPAELEPWVACVATADDDVTHALPMLGRRPLLADPRYPNPTACLVGGLRIRAA